MIFILKRKRTRSDSVLWQKIIHRQKKIQKSNLKTQNATINFEYRTIADRLRTVSWSNDSWLTGVVKPVYGIPSFPLTPKLCNQKEYSEYQSTFKNWYNYGAVHECHPDVLFTTLELNSNFWCSKRLLCNKIRLFSHGFFVRKGLWWDNVFVSNGCIWLI